MSVHTKKRVSPHKHFQDEVIEAKNVRPNRPAYKVVHSSDVVINSILTLVNTPILWTRLWEAEDAESKDSEWVEVSDAAASGGKALKILSTDPNDKAIQFVTGDIGIGGELNLIVRAKVANNASASNVLHFGIWDVDGGAWLGSARYVKANEFPASNEYHHFALKVEVPEDKNNLQVMLKFSGNGVTNVWCDFGGFVPANVPLDFADVDTDTHSGTVAALAYSDITEILNETDSNIAVAADTWTEIFSGVCSSESNAINLARIYISIVRDATFNNRKYFLRLDIGGSIKDIRYGAHWGATGSPQTTPHQLYIYDNLSGDTVKIYLYAEGGASQYSTTVIVSQYKKHNHTMTNPDDHTETASGHEH